MIISLMVSSSGRLEVMYNPEGSNQFTLAIRRQLADALVDLISKRPPRTIDLEGRCVHWEIDTLQAQAVIDKANAG